MALGVGQGHRKGGTVKAASLQLRVGRIVWHGPGAPEASALAAALEAALARALAQQPAAPAADALSRQADAVVRQLLPALANAGVR